VPLGVPFYLWVGLFNVVLVAQFWAFANDVYTQKKGERLFGVIGIGGSLGAIIGALVAGRLFESVGPYSMMLISAACLAVTIVLTICVHRRETRSTGTGAAEESVEAVEKPLAPGGGFSLVFKSRYLLMIALLVVISNCVNTTGEFILGKTVSQTAQAATLDSADPAAATKTYIGQFYADFFFWVNLIGAGLQVLIVSRLMQSRGAASILLLLPLIALGSYAMLAVLPILGLIRIAKIAENSVDYSIQNTARHALFLSTSREEKYKAKTAIDSFFWRIGDTLSGLLVLAGTLLALNVQSFAAVNVALTVVWLGVVFAIMRYARKNAAGAEMAR
jgi:AAA family ATP:ADP antiporter